MSTTKKINIDVLVGLLEPEFLTVAARNSEQALELLEIRPLPDLILLDIKMPGLNGYETCKIIKSHPKTKDIPVIFITAKTEEQDEARAFQAGAVDYITKPFSLPITMARVRTHVELKRHRDILERLAGRDGLTDIPNRRRFDEVLNEEWKRSKRSGRCFSLIFVDIDFFKSYNDHYGHAQGDVCLKMVARVISRSIKRSEDLAARYGGEEFACILPETPNTGALAVAKSILENMRSLCIPHAGSSIADYVTVSIGLVTTVNTADVQALELLEAADRALYRAKETGRNCIINMASVPCLETD